MTQNPAAADWAGARGEKWRAQADGMEATLTPIDDPLITALHVDRALRIADVGCGGGKTTTEIARRAPAGSVVHGFDISPGLIELARSRARSSHQTVSFEIANVATSAPPGDPYERLASRFGIMFFDDPLAAFTNLSNWLVAGGRFAFAVWDHPSNNPWFTTVRNVVADVIELPPLNPDAPGPFRYGAVDALVALLERAGFTGIDVRNWRDELAIGGGLPATQAATLALASLSSFNELLAEAGDQAVTRARHTLEARFAKAEQNGTVRLQASVHFVTGSRPAR